MSFPPGSPPCPPGSSWWTDLDTDSEEEAVEILGAAAENIGARKGASSLELVDGKIQAVEKGGRERQRDREMETEKPGETSVLILVPLKPWDPYQLTFPVSFLCIT